MASLFDKACLPTACLPVGRAGREGFGSSQALACVLPSYERFHNQIGIYQTISSTVRWVRAAGGEVHVRVAVKTQTKRSRFYKKQGMKRTA